MYSSASATASATASGGERAHSRRDAVRAQVLDSSQLLSTRAYQAERAASAKTALDMLDETVDPLAVAAQIRPSQRRPASPRAGALAASRWAAGARRWCPAPHRPPECY